MTIVTGTVEDCEHMSGTVSIPQIQLEVRAIDSHVMGCALVDGGDCSTTAPLGGTSQAAFVDNTQPVFTPSGSTDFHSVRLATGATCADTRAALPLKLLGVREEHGQHPQRRQEGACLEDGLDPAPVGDEPEQRRGAACRPEGQDRREEPRHHPDAAWQKLLPVDDDRR